MGQSFFPPSTIHHVLMDIFRLYVPADTQRNVFIQLIVSKYHLTKFYIVVQALSKATAVFVESLSLHKLKDYSLNLKRAESLRW